MEGKWQEDKAWQRQKNRVALSAVCFLPALPSYWTLRLGCDQSAPQPSHVLYDVGVFATH